MINNIVEWERRLELEAEQRKGHHPAHYVNYLAKPQAPAGKRKPILARIAALFARREAVHPDPVEGRRKTAGARCQP
ncbi:MAG: hypothetical protein ACOYYS_15950 [Chloroflexota bacterium]